MRRKRRTSRHGLDTTNTVVAGTITGVLALPTCLAPTQNLSVNHVASNK